MKRLFIGVVAALLVATPILLGPAFAQPKFPPLSGRVVDQADILSAGAEADLTQKLAALEASTTDQVVVATVPSLQGYEIEEFGYQLGRAWGIGTEAKDNGVVFIVAPNERKVRIEVGYGLEPVLTDALSSTIIQGQVIPRFKAGDMEGGVVAGTDAILQQLQRPEDEARAIAAQAGERQGAAEFGFPAAPLVPILFFLVLFFVLSRIGRRRRRRSSGLGGVLPWIILDSIARSGRGSGWGGGGGWSGGGGGFGGGGGSFGGGGSSGSW
jgi:uncharacterized protein